MQRPTSCPAVQADTNCLRKGEVLLDNNLNVNQTCALVVKETNHILGCINKWWFLFIQQMWESTSEAFYPFLGSPAQERHWHTGTSSAEYTKLVRGWSLWHKRRSWEMICSFWRREELMVSPTAIYNYLMEKNIVLQNITVGKWRPILYAKPIICYYYYYYYIFKKLLLHHTKISKSKTN